MTERMLIESLLKNEPYLGPIFRAFQGDPRRHAYMTALVPFLAADWHRDLIEILEVGSWAGGSALTWGLALKEARVAGRVTCVDPWQPYFDTDTNSGLHYREMNDAAETGLIYRLFLHNIRAAGLADIVKPIRGKSAEILPTLPEASFSIVFLDGSHHYNEVSVDIRSAMRLVCTGGILCGDDLELTAADIDPVELAQAVESGADFVAHKASGRSYHPGVTKAVGEMLPPPSVWEGFWALRRTVDGWSKFQVDERNVVVPAHLPHVVAPQLLESYRGFNIVRFDTRIFGVRQSLGEIPWNDGYERLSARFNLDDFLSAPTIDDVKQKIDSVSPETQVSGFRKARAQMWSGLPNFRK
jgi:predicted O-methyltransferase YrrM